ncbi:MAG TPA: tetratricopeptide repeat protein, partial [Vicinamibacterales bacterium]|nr:tetratricopeptide repeat protein [Vicinamibacterales bacterium]
MARKKGGTAHHAPAPPAVTDTVAEGRAWFAIVVFGIALLVRLAHLWQMRRSPFFALLMGDSRGYDEWARRIAGGEWLGHEVFYQAPLYPYLLGVIYAVAGRHLFLVRLVQALIGSASCALLALAGARLFSRRAGMVAGLMLALYAPAIFFDGLLQKSVLDVFFVCLALWLISRSEKTAKTAKRFFLYLALGLTMGGLALTRENALVFILVILAWIIVQGLGSPQLADSPRKRRRQGWGLAGRTAGMFLAGLAIVLVPVAGRNAYVGGGFYVTTSQFGPNFYIGNNPAADGTYQSLRFGRGAPEFERQDATELAERALGKRLTPAEVSGYWSDKALDFVTSRPGAWLALMARKVALLWNATEMVDTESQEAHAEWSLPLRLGGVAGHFGILVPLALFGVIVTWRMRARIWVLYAMTLAYAASVVVFYVFARYRYPLVPLLILFAAAGVAGAREYVRRADPAWALGAVAAVAVFCNWPILSTTLMRAVTETNVGTALQSEGRLDEAIDHYHRAIALSPEFPPAYNNLATSLRAQGDLAGAIATYQQALRMRPEYPDAEYNLANALLQAGKPAEAVDHFRAALQTIPASVDVHNNLGIALVDEGRGDEAIAEFRAALELDPDSAQSHLNLGNALGMAHRYDEAIPHFRRAAQINPTDASVHYDLGSLLMEADRLEPAIAEFR